MGAHGVLDHVGQERWYLKAEVGSVLEHGPCLGAALQFSGAGVMEEAASGPSRAERQPCTGRV